MEISSPQQIVDLLSNLKLDDKQKQKLNRDLANMARRHFRAQISAQKAINGKSYPPRKTSKAS
ncbi:MAG: virion morphogenesis protein, partial [Hydrogenovibrio crunogenus]|nr:virion morphogenesis protein [Hydrogenovibrio crunogenus]